MAARNQVKVSGSGILAKDPEVKTTKFGKLVTLCYATDGEWTDRDGNKRGRPATWHNIVVGNERLVPIAESLRKGSAIEFSGANLVSRSWTDRDGNTRYNTDIKLEFGSELNGRQAEGGRGQTQEGGAVKKTEKTHSPQFFDDDVPF